jgi:hypothetical protein
VRPPAIARCFCAALVFLASAAYAADPPARVGRLSFAQGTVSYHLADQEQWSAVLNYPVSSGTSFWTEPGARAEIQTGAANLRVGQTTELDVTQLDDAGTALFVGQGQVNVQVHSVQAGGIHVATPHGEATLLRPGRYRIDVSPRTDDAPPSQSEVTVLEGEAQLSELGYGAALRAGESAVLTGDPVRVTRREANLTPLDDWALVRERQLVAAETSRYVSREIPGYQDLEAHGRWRNVLELGQVWYPRSMPAGLPIATATGPTFHLGDGPGSTMHPGVSRRSTTAAGCTTIWAGAGIRDRYMSARSMRRRWLLSSVAPAGEFRSPRARRRRSAGCPWRRAKRSCRTTRRAAPTSATST